MANNTISVQGEGGTTALTGTHTQTRRLPWLRGDMAIAFFVLLPSIIAVGLFIYVFIAYTFYISTVKWNSVVPDFSFVGLENWIRLFQDSRFHMNIRNLLIYAAGFMTQCIVFGFLLASLIDQHIKGEAFFRTLFIFPFAVSGIVTGVAWRWLFQPSTGINLLFGWTEGFEFLGRTVDTPMWTASRSFGMWAVTIAAAWQFTGYVMALYLAGLRGISNELREAAAIDGAGTWAIYRYVIVPLLMPVTFVVIVLTGMNSIRVFDLVAALGGSGPAMARDTLAFYMYQSTFGMYRFAQGATIGAFMIILAAFLVVPYMRSMRGEVER